MVGMIKEVEGEIFYRIVALAVEYIRKNFGTIAIPSITLKADFMLINFLLLL